MVDARSPASAPLSLPTPADLMADWYVAVKGRCDGPFSYEALVTRAKSGALRPADFVWRAGFKHWTELSERPDLGQLLPARPTLGVVAPNVDAAEKAKTEDLSLTNDLVESQWLGEIDSSDARAFDEALAAVTARGEVQLPPIPIDAEREGLPLFDLSRESRPAVEAVEALLKERAKAPMEVEGEATVSDLHQEVTEQDEAVALTLSHRRRPAWIVLGALLGFSLYGLQHYFAEPEIEKGSVSSAQEGLQEGKPEVDTIPAEDSLTVQPSATKPVEQPKLNSPAAGSEAGTSKTQGTREIDSIRAALLPKKAAPPPEKTIEATVRKPPKIVLKKKEIVPTDVLVALPPRIEPEALRRTVAYGGSDINRCFRADRLGEGLSKTTSFALTVRNSGKVVRVRVVEGDKKSSKVVSCLLRKMRRWNFGPFEGPDNQVQLAVKPSGLVRAKLLDKLAQAF